MTGNFNLLRWASCWTILFQSAGKSCPSISPRSFNDTSWLDLPATAGYAIVSLIREADMPKSITCEVTRQVGWRVMTIDEAVLTPERQGRCVECTSQCAPIKLEQPGKRLILSI
jgi:hypothetical protein